MRHRRQRGKLGVTTKHRRALLRNMVRNLVIYKQIRTTVNKAKVASAFADKMVQIAKGGDLHARRLLISKLGCPDTADALIARIAPKFKERQGGYTRVLKMGTRAGDGATAALLEFTETIEAPAARPETRKAKKDKPKKAAKTAAPAPAAEKAKESKEPSSKKKEEKKESEKRGGFLGTLRKFLKGDDQ